MVNISSFKWPVMQWKKTDSNYTIKKKISQHPAQLSKLTLPEGKKASMCL